MSWREWFNRKANPTLGECSHTPFLGTLYLDEEARYQNYKARLIEELAVQTDELLRPAELVEKPASPRPWY